MKKNRFIFSLVSLFSLILYLSCLQLCSGVRNLEQTLVDDQDLLIKIVYTLNYNKINIEFQLLNDSFVDTFDISLIGLQINSKECIQTRSFKDLQKNVVILKIKLVEAIKDLSIVITAKKNELKTRSNKILNEDFQYVIDFGTQLPEFLKLDIRQSISWMQNSTIMDILRLFPFYLVIFNQIQGILVILLADVTLPQRFYEILRLFSCFVFKNVETWPASQEYPHSLNQQSIFGHTIENSDEDVHISRIGVHENIFIQVFYYFITLAILWILYFIFSNKKNVRAKNFIINLLSGYHKVTLLLLLIVTFSQIRMMKYLESSVAVASFVFALMIIFYLCYLLIIMVKHALKRNDDVSDQSIEQNAYFDFRNCMRLHFLSYNSSLNLYKKENMFVTSKIINYFPLCSLLFKVFIAFVLVFMQQTKQAQIIILILSYLLYFLFSLRYFIINSRALKTLKILSQTIFLGLLLFTFINSLLLDNEINSLPTNVGHSISDSMLNSINGLEILQILLMCVYFLIEMSIKVFQTLNLISQLKEIQYYDSNNRIYIPKKQIQQISKAFIEMLNTQKLNSSHVIYNKQQDVTFTETKNDKDRADFQSCFPNSLKNSIILAFKPNSQNTNNFVNGTQQINPQATSNYADVSPNSNSGTSKKNLTFSQRLQPQQAQNLENSPNQKISNKSVQEDKRINLPFADQQPADQKKRTESITIKDFRKEQPITPKNFIEDASKIQKQTTDLSDNSDFLKIPTNLKPILKPSKYLDQQNQIQQQPNNNFQQILLKGSSVSCDQSDIDAFSSIQKVLTNESEPKDDAKNESKMNEIMKCIMKSNIKTIQMTENYQKSILDYLDPLSQNKEFRNASQPYSLLVSSEVIEKVKDKYDNNSFEYNNTISFIKEATITFRKDSNGNVKKVEPYYNQKNVSITKHNFEKYQELNELFKKKKGSVLQINTRIFMDIEKYPLNSKVKINSHLTFSYCFQVTE